MSNFLPLFLFTYSGFLLQKPVLIMSQIVKPNIVAHQGSSPVNVICMRRYAIYGTAGQAYAATFACRLSCFWIVQISWKNLLFFAVLTFPAHWSYSLVLLTLSYFPTMRRYSRGTVVNVGSMRVTYTQLQKVWSKLIQGCNPASFRTASLCFPKAEMNTTTGTSGCLLVCCPSHRVVSPPDLSASCRRPRARDIHASRRRIYLQ